MTTFLFYFTPRWGGSMRKAMQAAGVAFEVKDIPRQPRSGCGLCILLEDGSRCARLDRPGTDGGAVSAERGSMALSRHLPTCRLIAHHKTRRRETVQQAVHEKTRSASPPARPSPR